MLSYAMNVYIHTMHKTIACKYKAKYHSKVEYNALVLNDIRFAQVCSDFHRAWSLWYCQIATVFKVSNQMQLTVLKYCSTL